MTRLPRRDFRPCSLSKYQCRGASATGGEPQLKAVPAMPIVPLLPGEFERYGVGAVAARPFDGSSRARIRPDVDNLRDCGCRKQQPNRKHSKYIGSHFDLEFPLSMRDYGQEQRRRMPMATINGTSEMVLVAFTARVGNGIKGFEFF